MDKILVEAIEHRGFSLVEVISNCHTHYGRLNRLGQAIALLRTFQEKATPKSKTKVMSEEEYRDKIITGVLHRDDDKTELCDEYQKLIDSLKNGKKP
jgi:2-oxoglutarate ferredoxin oxidoreductase subunit beta